MKASIGRKDVMKLKKTKGGFRTRFFLFKRRLSGLKDSRVAFVFQAKTANAVKRNLFKRRIRELVRLYGPSGRGCDHLCIAVASLENITRQEWLDERQSIQKMLS